MTLLETRQLGIEFERRLQTLSEQFVIVNKLDTDTIYAYLNEAQKQVYSRLYNTMLNTTSDKEQVKYLSSMLGKFVRTKQLSEIDFDDIDPDHEIEWEEYENAYELPNDFYAYLRSNSALNRSYVGPHDPAKRVQNIFLRHEDFAKYTNEYFDQGVIIRRPIALIVDTPVTSDNTTTFNKALRVHHDQYTDIKAVQLYYYRWPENMNILGDAADMKACELPYACFEELVETALQLYLIYAKGNIANNDNNQPRTERKERKAEENAQ